ncbi:hypothetical protein [Enterocloster citroniae]|uniref:hypothetical protein n=1 Tax=Enterocloster citroniae TaxID=358743 RepID=UPI00349E64B9
MEKKNMYKEIPEAIAAANRALASLEEARQYLSKAAGWGIWDMLGGGLFGTFMKHSRMEEARQSMESARLQLRRLKRELLDVDLPGEFKLDVGNFLTFADYFFDGIVADWMVQSKINEASDQVREAVDRVTRIRGQLYDLQSSLADPQKGEDE